jgi:hypothetical protein
VTAGKTIVLGAIGAAIGAAVMIGLGEAIQVLLR